MPYRVSRWMAAAAVLAALAIPARAQHLGDVSLSSVTQTLFPAGTACTGASQTATINNLGQTSHSLLVTITAGAPTLLTYFLEGSNDGTTFTRLSDESDGNLPGQLQASGYFAVVRANITCAPAVTTAFLMTYSGSGVPQAQPAGDGLRAQMEKTLVNGTSTGTSQSGTVRTPYGNLSGLLLISSTGAFPGGSTLSITCTYVQGSGPTQTFALAGSSGLFAVNAAPCAVGSWSYTAGGASGATLVIEYIFSTGFSGAGGNGTGAGGGGGTTTVVGNLTNNNAAPAANNVGALTAVANAIAPTFTEGDEVLESEDLRGGLRMIGGNIPETTAAWTSATPNNTTLQQNVLGYSSVIVSFNQTTTITAGQVSFEVSDTTAFTNAYSIGGQQGPVNSNKTANIYVFVANVNQSFKFTVAGWAAFRVHLTAVITGTGTVNVGIQSSAQPNEAEVVGIATASTVNVQSPNARTNPLDNETSLSHFPDSSGSNGALAVGDLLYGGAFSGTNNAALVGYSKARTSTIFKTVSVAATATGNTAVWTPAAGNKFRLLAFQITAQGLAATATGVVTVSFQDSAAAITTGTYDVDVPAVAGVVSGVNQISGGAVQLGFFGVLSAAANNVLNFNISAAGAGTVGTYRVNVWGTEE